MHMTEISIYVKSSRAKLGLTQKVFANLLGKKRYNIAKYETGKAIPPGDIVLKIQKLISKQGIDISTNC